MISIRQLRHLPRIKEITTILVKHGLEQTAEVLGLSSLYERVGQLMRKEAVPEAALTLPQRLRAGMQELGPTFIKLGQILSTRRDLLSEEYIEEFSRLQDSVPPMDVDTVRSVFLRELGKPPEELFAQFNPVALAAASIGQVHRARLHTGEDVVVKVQRVGIHGMIRSDLEILYFLVRKMEEAELVDRIYGTTDIVDEFSRSIRQELDYHREAHNMSIFRAQFEGNPNVHIPLVYDAFSTSRLLCMEFIPGKKATKWREVDCDPKLLARIGAQATLEMVFANGCFHADPHPGNIIIMPNDILCFMDFGMVGRLSQKQRDHLAWLLIHLTKRDYDAMARALIDVAEPLEDVDVDALATSLLDTLDPYHGVSLSRIDFGGLIRSTSRLLVRYRLQLPSSYTLMLKALVSIESLGKSLDPDFDITALARPFVGRLILDRWQPGRLAHDMELFGLDALALIRRVPQQAAKILTKLQHGSLEVVTNHRGIQPLTRALDQGSSRLAFAIVVGALMLGSAHIMVATGGHINELLGVVGILGFIASGGLSCILVLAILRSGGL